jgi:3-ketosteroid 9alpha-monooxygenase subunit B
MVRGIFGINKILAIKSEPFIKNPLALINKGVKISSDNDKSLPESPVRTRSIIKPMTIMPKKNFTPADKDQLKKLKSRRGVVINAVKETADTWTLDIFVHDEDRNYLAGQFISINPAQFVELNDLLKFFEYEKSKKEPVRAYSLTSAPHEQYLAITIKPELYEPYPGAFPPLLSPILASNFLVGREIEFSGYTGAYVMPSDLPSHIDHVVHLVAGSGIVPSFSIIKDELINQKNLHTKHILIDVNKTLNDIIFHHQLTDLEKRHPDRLKIKHFISQEAIAPSTGYLHGRPSIEHVMQLVKKPENALFFACGPAITKWQKKQAQETGIQPKARFMEWVQDVIEKLNVDKKQFKREIYG